MSNIYKTKLNTIRKNILDGKNELSEALQFCGITNVKPNALYPHDEETSANYETFARYAELIRKLKSANSMIFQFTIPDTAITDYKRTIVLPMVFPTGGGVLNDIAKEIIGVQPPTPDKVDPPNKEKEEFEQLVKDNTIKDVYGNNCLNGSFNITLKDVDDFLDDEQSNEFLEAAKTLGITLSNRVTVADYDFTVDWGDGTEATYIDGDTYENNKAAIWHTYATHGVYDISINGNFRRIRTYGTRASYLVENGNYVYDTDGVYRLYENYNYGMINCLTSVISWGNTLLTHMEQAFSDCIKLVEIPMYDTTNSFEDVVTFYMAFRFCTSLKKLPFNSNTNKGLFSGCKKVTSFASTFYNCTGLTEPIPIKLIDGCINVRETNNMFAACNNITGSIPNGMFEGLTALTDASSMFAQCVKMDGEISSDMFKDCQNLTNIHRIFYNCSKITGRLTRDFIGGLSKLKNMKMVFYNCSGITGIDADAFYNIKSSDIDAVDAFYNCKGLTEIPEGLIESLTGSNLRLDRMFSGCSGIKSISQNALKNLNVESACCLFGGCTGLTSALPIENPDWSTYEGIQKWYGVFAECDDMANVNNIPLELGGNGNRRFPEGKVGAIVLQDKTFVEVKDYVYNDSNKPVGVVYADVYLDSTKMVPTLTTGEGNVVNKDNPNAVHKIFACTFNDTTAPWNNEVSSMEDVTTITNTSNFNVVYGKTRYNGEACHNAIGEFIAQKGYADSRYPAYEYCKNYNSGIDGVKCFLPDSTDLWNQYTQNELTNKALTKIINGGGGFDIYNCFPLRRSWYWASPERDRTTAWRMSLVSTTFSEGKQYSGYVRASFAL